MAAGLSGETIPPRYRQYGLVTFGRSNYRVIQTSLHHDPSGGSCAFDKSRATSLSALRSTSKALAHPELGLRIKDKNGSAAPGADLPEQRPSPHGRTIADNGSSARFVVAGKARLQRPDVSVN